MVRKVTAFLCVMVAVSAVALAQGDASKSLGFIPPYFRVPENAAAIRYTSLEQAAIIPAEYPAEHIRAEREGVVEVEVSVTAEGTVVYSVITVSSGDPLFDESALRSAMKTKFPAGYATMNGIPVDFRMTVPFYFMLSSDPEQYWHTRLELARVQLDYEKAMDLFQDYMMSRTTATKAKMEGARRNLEEKIAIARKLHRMLAEKKEMAILRLSDEINATKEQRESLHIAARTPDDNTDFRAVHGQETAVPSVQAGSSRANNVVMVALPHADDLERLTQELELKKSYL